MVKEYSIAKHFQLNARIGWQGLTTSEYLSHGSFLLVSGTDFESGNINWNSVVFVSEERFAQDKKIQLKEGDVLVTKDGTIGKVAIVDKLEYPATLNSGVFVVRPTIKEIDSKYFYYYLLSRHFKDFLSKLTAGSTITHLYQKDFVTYKFRFPSKKEQTAIATALSDMDSLIAATKKLLAKKGAIKQGLMQELLSGKTRLSGYIGDWSNKTIKTISSSIVRGPFGGALKKEFFVNTGYKVYQQRNAIYKDVELGTYFINESKFRDLERFQIKAGDFIISCSGTIGKIYQIPERYRPGVINQALLKITVNKKEIVEDYFFYQFTWENFQKKVIDDTQGGAMKNLVGMEKFKDTEITCPPTLQEQQSIANILKDCDDEIEQLGQKLQKLTNLKQGMMQELLTGRIRLVQPGKAYASKEESLPMAAEPSNEISWLGREQLDKEKEAAILAMLVAKSDIALGRFRYQKLMYLFHRKTDNAISGWLNKAAGPYNHDLRYGGVEDFVINQGWCRDISNGKEHPRYQQGTNSNQAKQQYLEHYSRSTLNWLKEYFFFKTDDELELLATVDKAKLSRTRNGLSADWTGVKQYIAQEPEWKDKLKKEHFSDDNLRSAVVQLDGLFEYE